jgi:hypothetical protein
MLGDTRPRRRPNRIRLFVEPLEDRTMLSASIFGSVFNDLVGNGVRLGTDPGLAGQFAYLDLNHTGVYGNTVNTVTRAKPNMISLGNGLFVSSIHVNNLPSQVVDVAVTIDLTNNSSDAVPIVLLSPTGLSSVLGTGDIFQGPYMFTIRPGQHFVGTFDGAATTSVNSVPAPVPNGTYAPQMSFANPQVFIENVDPNGVWGLLFLPPSGSSAGITLNSWSISFTQPEPSTHTDAAGNYSFTGIAAGTYNVNLAVPSGDRVTTAAGASQTVTVADGGTQTGVDFGVQPLPDLTSVAFNVVSGATAWGQPITIDYTLTNQGARPAGSFDVDLLLSSSGVISPADPALGTPLHFASLAAGASRSGSITVTLPAQAPSGFDPASPASAYVGFDIDSHNLVTETNKANNNNQGAGIDLALIGPHADVAVTTGSGVQQGPAIAIDPTDPNHIVTAYLDYTLVHTGYAGIGIAVSTDGGKSWTQSSVPLPAGFDQGAAAPAVAFDAQGNLFVSFMAVTFLGSMKPNLTNPTSSKERTQAFQSRNGIFVGESCKQTGNGGLTWTAPVAVSENVYSGAGTAAPTADPDAVPFDAYPQLAVDMSAASPYLGSIYVTWTRYYPGSAAAPQNQYPGGDPTTNIGGTDVYVAVSRDSNTTWTTQMKPSGSTQVSAIRDPFFGPTNGTSAVGNGFVKFSWVAVGADGAVYVSTDTGGYFTVYSSRNGGQTFRVPLIGPFGGNYRGNPFDYTQTGVLPNTTLDDFRTLRTREIVADPTRPGMLYAVAPSSLATAESQPGNLDAANGIVFAVSDDYGASWTTNFTVGAEPSPLASMTADQLNSGYMPVLNDDNGGQYPGFAASPQTQVAANQAFPSINVSPQGVITVIWYDTRTDPANHNIQVWGTVSSDGGQHWSANFPVSNGSFDPDTGAFTDANGHTDFYLGDQIGVAASGNTAYAVWTNAGGGAQKILSTSFSLSTLPQAPVDRFAPNFSQATATNLGVVTAQQVLPRLNLLPGSANEWFQLTAGATGELSLSVAATVPGASLNVVLTDAGGNVIPASVSNVVDASGSIVGQALVASLTSGQVIFVHVFGTSDAGIGYTLSVAALTADFGPAVEGTRNDSVATGGQDIYRLVAAVQGSLQVTLGAGASQQGNLNLQVLGADGQTVLAADVAGVAPGTSETLSLSVTQGQVVFLQVSGANLASSQGAFTLTFTNLDQFETASHLPGTSNLQTLFFPTTGDPNGLVAADLNLDGKMDLVASSTDGTDAVSVLMGNGDGTFQAEKQFAIGPGLNNGLLSGDRQLAVAALTSNGVPDIIVPNSRSSDVSVLLGNGDGSYQPQRRFDAVANPTDLVTGDFTGTGITDVFVLQGFTQAGNAEQIAYLQGRGDGTFLPPVLYNTAFTGASGDGPMVVGDFGNGHLDLIVFSKNQPLAQIFLGDGHGHFTDGGVFHVGESTFSAAAVDLLGNGHLDLITTGTNTGNVYVMMGHGDGTFQPPVAYQAMAGKNGGNVVISGLTVVDFGSPGAPGTPDGNLDIIVTAASRNGGAAEVIMLPGLDHQGNFGTAMVLANVAVAGEIVAGTFALGGGTDLAVADKGGITVIYGSPITLTPNTTSQHARALGSVDHLTTLPQSIVMGHEDAYFNYVVPTEAVPGAGSQVVDISALFGNLVGSGLSMVVTDPAGNVYAGPRVRIVAAQGEVLTIHIFGNSPVGTGSSVPGAGTYVLDIDVLPQVVGIQAEAADPSISAITSLVITLQGDRLDTTAAQNPANYSIRYLTSISQQTIVPASIQYDAGASIQPGSNLYYPTAARHTITLYFSTPLQPGSYALELSAAIQSASNIIGEAHLLVPAPGFNGHPVVFVNNQQQISEGTSLLFTVSAPGGSANNVSLWKNGTPFFQQSYDNLGAMLDALLAAQGDAPTISSTINNAIVSQFYPGVQSTTGAPQALALIWVDPVSIDLADAGGNRAVFDLQSNTVVNNLTNTFIEVGSNIQLIVMAATAGSFSLNLGNVGSTARGGVVMLTPGQTQMLTLTDAIRSGDTTFALNMPQVSAGGNSSSPEGGPASGSSPEAVGLTAFPPGASALQSLFVVLAIGLVRAAAPAGEIAGGTASRNVTAVIPDSGDAILEPIPPPGIGSVVEGVQAIFNAGMGAMGLPDAALPNLGLQKAFSEVGRGLMNLGGNFAARLEGWVRTRLGANGNGQPVGAPAAPPVPMAQPNDDGEDSETAALLDDNCTAVAEDKLDGLMVAALFATGAYFGAALSREDEDAVRKLQRVPAAPIS